jgi:hypothetical protein
MLLQNLHIDVKVIAFDQARLTTIYSLNKDSNGEIFNGEIKVVDADLQSESAVSGLVELTPKLLGLSIIPFDTHTDEAYTNFKNEFSKGLLIAHKHSIDDFKIIVSQAGYNFKLNGIESTKIQRFKAGDKVMMVGSHEATFPENESKVWTCLNDSFIDKGKDECVHLEGFSGAYFCKYLALVKS